MKRIKATWGRTNTASVLAKRKRLITDGPSWQLFFSLFFVPFPFGHSVEMGKAMGYTLAQCPKGLEFGPWFEPEVIVQDGCDDRGEAVKRLESEKGKIKHKRVGRLGKL